MANWGIGLEILKALHRNRLIKNIITISRCTPKSNDPWENAVYNHALELGYETWAEKQIHMEALIRKIYDSCVDLMVTHAYMKILPRGVFSTPKFGAINIHASLLPKYRGPSPNQWVLKNRESETGLTCHYIDERVDTGDIIHQVKISVKKGDTVATIIEKEKQLIEQLINESLSRILSDSFIPSKQIDENAIYAPRIIEEHAL